MRLAYLDFLLFIAATAVLLQHYLEIVFPETFHLFLELSPGVFGVVLFFFISGYVIPFSVQRNFTIDNFIVRRIFRIFPAYLVVLALTIGFAALGFHPWHETLAKSDLIGFAANIFLVQDYVGRPAFVGVSWTLSVEFVWYAIYLAAFLYWGNKRAFTLALAGSAVVIALSFLSIAVDARLPLGRIGMINAALIGYCAFLMHHQSFSPQRFQIAVAAFIASMLISQYVSFGYFNHPNISLFNGFSGWITATVLFLLFVLVPRLQTSPLSNGKIPALLGEVSYSVYLMHGLVFHLLSTVMGGIVLLICATAGTLATSWVMFTIVEKGGVKLGKQLTTKLASSPISLDSTFQKLFPNRFAARSEN